MVDVQRPRDRYDQEVERLTVLLTTGSEDDRLDALKDAWAYCRTHSPLFDACGSMRVAEPGTIGDYVPPCGCATEVASYKGGAETNELTLFIRGLRLPGYVSAICVEHLPIFADVQRRVDRDLGRTPPPMLPEETQEISCTKTVD